MLNYSCFFFLIHLILKLIRWLDDINRKQAELVAAQDALENLRQRHQPLKNENELLRVQSLKLLLFGFF